MRISDWSSDVCSSDLSNRPWHCRVPHKKRCADNSLWPVAAGGQCHSFSILPSAPLPPNPLPDPAPPAARLSSAAPRSCTTAFKHPPPTAPGNPRQRPSQDSLFDLLKPVHPPTLDPSRHHDSTRRSHGKG